MQQFQRNIDDLVYDLKKRGKKCTVLIGAGCSAKADIPLARKFVEIIKEEFPKEYERATAKEFPQCMAQLNPSDRRKLIARYIDKAPINWAHICLALLMTKGIVDRVLTVNFDPLVIKACALFGHFPAVYDFASSRIFQPENIPEQAIFYLHGLRTGFVWKTSQKEVAAQSKHLRPVIEDAMRNRVWIVVGYSGENDPVFRFLSKARVFNDNLYWVCYDQDEPPPHVRRDLLKDEKFAFYINGYDADDFFATVAKKLDCFPPGFIRNPFLHLNELLNQVTAYSFPGQNSDMKLTAQTAIQEAIGRFDKEQTGKANSLLISGDYDAVISMQPDRGKVSPELAEAISWAYIMQGIDLYKAALTKANKDADLLFEQATAKYSEALKVRPDKYEAVYNWGLALYSNARRPGHREVDRLLSESSEKFEAAVKLKPDDPDSYYNWGLALADQAKLKQGKREEESLLKLASKKYEKAIELKPDYYDALTNYGNALLSQAKTRHGAAAEVLFTRARENYEAAVKAKPDGSEAYYNWGVAFFAEAEKSTGDKARDLFVHACEQYQMALRIKPDYADSLNNWGMALAGQAGLEPGPEADKLFEQAYKKFEEALQVKTDFYDAYDSWGLSLTQQAKTKTDKKAVYLLKLAGEKFSGALEIKPDYYYSLESWGTALAAQAALSDGDEAVRLFALAARKFAEALAINSQFVEAYEAWAQMLEAQARTKKGEEASRLVALAKEKREAVRRITQSSGQ